MAGVTWRLPRYRTSSVPFLLGLALTFYLFIQVIPSLSRTMEWTKVFESRGRETRLPTPPSRYEMPSAERSILGSRLQGLEERSAFWALLNCWTRQGQWVYDSDRGVPVSPRTWPLLDPGYRSCDHPFSSPTLEDNATDRDVQWGREDWEDEMIIRETIRWHWKTPESLGCPLQLPHRQELCQLLRKRPVIMMGDPTQLQLVSTLLLRMGQVMNNDSSPRFRSSPCPGNITDCTIYPLCDHKEREDEDLPSTMTPSSFSSSSTYLISVMDPSLQRLDRLPSVLQSLGVRGTSLSPLFITSNGPLTNSTQLRENLGRLRSVLPYETLHIHRSGYASHPGCSALTLHPAPRPPYYLPVEWEDLQAYHAILRQEILEAGGVWWDVEGMMLLREDGHVQAPSPAGDPGACIEWCLPGPVEAWESTLYGILGALLPP
ncbi:MAG: hypothetical protein DHS80DRAFT_24317 [Piptocephalis tieghemiana]|nr:MAG: hypothetical protein DHS80DRAFT_24317 [Piptocephalis tieghemiana]